jgi:hypothetical protein
VGRRRPLIGGKVGNREVGFVTDAADHRQRTGADRPRHGLVVECPEVFDAAATAADDQHFAFPTLAGIANGFGDLRGRPCHPAPASGRGRCHLAGAASERAQDVAQRRRLQRGDDADAAWKRRQGALAALSNSPSRRAFLEAKELFVEVADAGPTRRFDVELEIPACLVERDQHARLDVLAILQSPAEQLRAAAEHDAAHLRGAVLERKVDMPGSRMAEVGDSPATQHRGKAASSRSRARRLSRETGITGTAMGQAGDGGVNIWHAADSTWLPDLCASCRTRWQARLARASPTVCRSRISGKQENPFLNGHLAVSPTA